MKFLFVAVLICGGVTIAYTRAAGGYGIGLGIGLPKAGKPPAGTYKLFRLRNHPYIMKKKLEN